MTRWLGLFLLVALAPMTMAWDQAEQDRFRQLTEELRCLVCQNQSIAASQAPLAEDLRRQVRSRIESGQSDAQIREYMTERYGDFVLYRPPLKPRTWALWFGPAILLLAGLLLAWRLRRSTAPPAPVDEQQLADILRRSEND